MLSLFRVTEANVGQKRHHSDDRETPEDLTPLRNRVGVFYAFTLVSLHCGREIVFYFLVILTMSYLLFSYFDIIFIPRHLESLL